MRKNFCEKCSAILPKGKMICSRCGYENPELIPVLRSQIMRQIFFKRIIIIATVIALILTLNANLLFPWQAETRKNKRAIFNYANEHYPHAKVVRSYYESAKFNPWSPASDFVVFEWNGVQFAICAWNGEVVADNYSQKASKNIEKNNSLSVKYNATVQDMYKMFVT